MDLTDKSQLIKYLKENGLYTQHELGQNFLVDRAVLDRIVEAADIQPGEFVIEVGSGHGVLSEEIVRRTNSFLGIEIDKKLADLTTKRLNASILNADILRINLNELTKNKRYKVVANIPYYITSKILQLFLSAGNKPDTIVVLTQKEVAERICADPGDMSVLSVSVQSYGKPEIAGMVPKEAFFPSPKIDSAILKISGIHPFCEAMSEKDFFRIVHIGFASRRKTLCNNLAAGLNIDKKNASDIIKSIGLSDQVRAQELSVNEWIRLACEI